MVDDQQAPAQHKIPAKDLMREKTLLALYLLSYKFPSSKFNVGVTIVTVLSLSALAFFTRHQLDLLASTSRALIAFGTSAVPSILGFLIAGFTIFVTVTKSEIFVYMARKPYKKTGESFLKYNLTAFALAFVHYLAYLFVVALLVIFAQPQSTFLSFVKWGLGQRWVWDTAAYNALLCAFLVVFGTWTMYLVLLLKSFVYNTYQVVTTAVRWEMVQDEQRQKRAIAAAPQVSQPNEAAIRLSEPEAGSSGTSLGTTGDEPEPA